MRGPLRLLWHSRLAGRYLRFRLVLVLASLLATIGAVVVLGVGGVWGIVVLLGLVVTFFSALAAIVAFR